MAKLALDLGTTTGFAYSAARGCVTSGTWDLRPKKYQGAGMRYVRFEAELDALHAAQPIDTVWFEAVRRHIGTDAAHVYGGLMATLEAWCEKNGVPYDGVPVGTIKKFWTGNGAAKKDLMIECAVARGFDVVDDNEADAIALLCFKVDGIWPTAESPLPAKAQKEAA